MSTETSNYTFYHGQQMYINGDLYAVAKIKELPLTIPALEIEIRIADKSRVSAHTPKVITIQMHQKPTYN